MKESACVMEIPEMKESVRPVQNNLWAMVRYGIGGLVLLTLGGTTFISLKSLQSLSSEVNQLKAPRQGSPDIAPLQAQLATLQQRFESLQTQQKGMAEKSALTALQQQAGTLDKQLHEQAASVAALNTGLFSLRSQLQTLNQRPASPVAVKAAAPTSVTTKKKPTRKAQRQFTAPFMLTGIEQRGGIAFAAVAPSQAASLAEITLLEPGETRQGWTLVSVSGQQAQFRVSGTVHTLKVH